jgi:hypothetical protein
LYWLYATERGPGGVMKVEAPAVPVPSPREMHRVRCANLGITEPAKVARLWEEERALIEKARAESGRPPRGHGRRGG